MIEIERQAAMEKQKQTGLEEDAPDTDPMLEEAINVVVENGMASTSLRSKKHLPPWPMVASKQEMSG